VGYTAPISKDYFQTPYGPMAGLWIHAHMVSQMTSAVLDNRPLISGLPQWGQWQWGDWLWVLVWSGAGGYAGWCIKAQSRWLLSLALGGGALYGLCWGALISGLWLPLVPSVLAAAGSTVWLRLSRYAAGGFAVAGRSPKQPFLPAFLPDDSRQG
jgi:CHASE2 domain-containing sensor protein